MLGRLDIRGRNCVKLLVGAVLPGVPVHSAESNKLLVGAAQVDITPPVWFCASGGYEEVISTGVDDPLDAKALMIRQAKSPVCRSLRARQSRKGAGWRGL